MNFGRIVPTDANGPGSAESMVEDDVSTSSGCGDATAVVCCIVGPGGGGGGTNRSGRVGRAINHAEFLRLIRINPGSRRVLSLRPKWIGW